MNILNFNSLQIALAVPFDSHHTLIIQSIRHFGIFRTYRIFYRNSRNLTMFTSCSSALITMPNLLFPCGINSQHAQQFQALRGDGSREPQSGWRSRSALVVRETRCSIIRHVIAPDHGTVDGWRRTCLRRV